MPTDEEFDFLLGLYQKASTTVSGMVNDGAQIDGTNPMSVLMSRYLSAMFIACSCASDVRKGVTGK